MNSDRLIAHDAEAGARIWPWFAIALAIFALFWALAAWLRSSEPANPAETQYEWQRAEGRRKTLAELRKANDEALLKYAWVDKEKGIVRIPIKEAMALEISALNASKPHPAYPVQTPSPSATPVPPAGSAAVPGAAAPASQPAQPPSSPPAQPAQSE